MQTPRHAVVVAAFATALALTGCSGGDSAAEGPKDVTAGDTGSGTETPTDASPGPEAVAQEWVDARLAGDCDRALALTYVIEVDSSEDDVRSLCADDDPQPGIVLTVDGVAPLTDRERTEFEGYVSGDSPDADSFEIPDGTTAEDFATASVSDQNGEEDGFVLLRVDGEWMVLSSSY